MSPPTINFISSPLVPRTMSDNHPPYTPHELNEEAIIGPMPRGIIHWGHYAFATIFALVLLGSWLFRMPEIAPCPVLKILDDCSDLPGREVQVVVPPRFAAKIGPGQSATLQFAAWPASDVGFVLATVSKLTPLPEAGQIIATLHLPQGLQTNRGIHLDPLLAQKGLAEIVVSNHRLLEQWLQPLRLILEKQTLHQSSQT